MHLKSSPSTYSSAYLLPPPRSKSSSALFWRPDCSPWFFSYPLSSFLYSVARISKTNLIMLLLPYLEPNSDSKFPYVLWPLSAYLTLCLDPSCSHLLHSGHTSFQLLKPGSYLPQRLCTAVVFAWNTFPLGLRRSDCSLCRSPLSSSVLFSLLHFLQSDIILLFLSFLAFGLPVPPKTAGMLT